MTNEAMLAEADRLESVLWQIPAYSTAWFTVRRAMWVLLSAITGVVIV